MFSPKKLLQIPSNYSHKWGQGGPLSKKLRKIRNMKNIRILFKKFFLLKKIKKYYPGKEQEISEKPVVHLSTRADERRIKRRFFHLLGGGYCSECGGPCTNHNHSR